MKVFGIVALVKANSLIVKTKSKSVIC